MGATSKCGFTRTEGRANRRCKMPQEKQGKRGSWKWLGIPVVLMILGLAVGGYFWLSQKEPGEYAGPLEKVTVAAYAGEAAALVYVATEQGFFVAHGLEVIGKDYETGKLAADALLAGEADIATSAGFVFVSNSFDHAELRVFGTVATAEVKELVARKDKGITAIGDLMGKKIGVTRKSGGEFALGNFLTFNDLSYEDVELVDLNPSEIAVAITNGDIDAAFTWDPGVFNIRKELGDNAVSWPGGEDFYFVLLTTADWIKNNPGAAERFLESLLEADEYVEDHSENAKAFVKDRFAYEADYIEYSWPRQQFAVVLEQAMLITFEDQARWRIENNLTDKATVPNFLDFIYWDALETVKPEAVGIIR